MTTNELEIWKRLNDCECVHPGYWLPLNGDRYIWIDADGNPHVKIYYIGKGEINGSCIWIPPLYDPIRPERSLWGIFKKIVVELNTGWEVKDWADSHIGRVAGQSDRPDLALARAILEGKEKG